LVPESDLAMESERKEDYLEEDPIIPLETLVARCRRGEKRKRGRRVTPQSLCGLLQVAGAGDPACIACPTGTYQTGTGTASLPSPFPRNCRDMLLLASQARTLRLQDDSKSLDEGAWSDPSPRKGRGPPVDPQPVGGARRWG
jgi:hypothetical protein